jgi:hypothetical protein
MGKVNCEIGCVTVELSETEDAVGQVALGLAETMDCKSRGESDIAGLWAGYVQRGTNMIGLISVRDSWLRIGECHAPAIGTGSVGTEAYAKIDLILVDNCTLTTGFWWADGGEVTAVGTARADWNAALASRGSTCSGSRTRH